MMMMCFDEIFKAFYFVNNYLFKVLKYVCFYLILQASAAGGSLNSMGVAGGRNGSGANNGLQYSIPGILHFLQHEWSRFEMERGQWEVERAELNVSKLF